MATRRQWADAYYRQALSDWALFRELLNRSDVPACQALHFLQMATEKPAKAYRFRDTVAGDHEPPELGDELTVKPEVQFVGTPSADRDA